MHIPNALHAALICFVLSFATISVAQADIAPDFTLPTDQGSVHLAELRGKVVYIDFWASWCAPCRASFPWMNEMKAKYGDQGLEVIAINLDKDRALAAKFLKKLPAQFTIAYDPEATTAKLYKIKGMPSSFVIDSNGLVQKSHAGFRNKDKAPLESLIQQLVRAVSN